MLLSIKRNNTQVAVTLVCTTYIFIAILSPQKKKTLSSTTETDIQLGLIQICGSFIYF